jgi:hypothetical protein
MAAFSAFFQRLQRRFPDMGKAPQLAAENFDGMNRIFRIQKISG